ncbi:hypothetical protein [Bradyrhizobium sp. ERR14]|uniref:hypothetical protein n=1 Tax=Bradyrhizobium sp. ERR14 TaxID=2663837 RepID=UPI00160BB4B4|nr:hypothetical protein [Bradyrhizobium sp. ERR14]MBB4398927.1 hypothetical protein [Bradyrhizobium sp. ERR14]
MINNRMAPSLRIYLRKIHHTLSAAQIAPLKNKIAAMQAISHVLLRPASPTNR